MILAVDSSGTTGAALVDDRGRPVAVRRSDDPRGHAEAIGPLLDAVLAGRASQVTAVAYGVGPGPFTGLRVGMAAARTAALVLGVPELPVLSHDAIALTALEGGAELPFVVVADAKRREVYATVYRTLDGAGVPVRDGEPEVGSPDRVPDLPRVTAPVDPAALGRVAARRRAAGLPPEPPEARYLRSPDVTLAAPKRAGG
ncbi:MAG TPA: tRNA (adenosine(37)-N6)-threonylcarbamoyltransferase complex dimerization subunit type 1 TsaB [Amnibacterium sp.]|nr:tRNA (adenosine(37)-N6)-threonylcarbamoyltransferase complex dimerization subunit type 1 TsaB [Amnibacterium sp.]